MLDVSTWNGIRTKSSIISRPAPLKQLSFTRLAKVGVRGKTHRPEFWAIPDEHCYRTVRWRVVACHLLWRLSCPVKNVRTVHAHHMNTTANKGSIPTNARGESTTFSHRRHPVMTEIFLNNRCRVRILAPINARNEKALEV